MAPGTFSSAAVSVSVFCVWPSVTELLCDTKLVGSLTQEGLEDQVGSSDGDVPCLSSGRSQPERERHTVPALCHHVAAPTGTRGAFGERVEAQLSVAGEGVVRTGPLCVRVPEEGTVTRAHRGLAPCPALTRTSSPVTLAVLCQSHRCQPQFTRGKLRHRAHGEPVREPHSVWLQPRDATSQEPGGWAGGGGRHCPL